MIIPSRVVEIGKSSVESHMNKDTICLVGDLSSIL